MQTFKKIFSLLNSQERKNAVLLTIMILIMAFLDMIGIATILPFITVLSNPDIIQTNIFLQTMFDASKIFGVENEKEFLFSLGTLMFLTLIISISFKALTTYFQVKFVQMCQYNISKRLVRNYLYQPYSWFLDRHSADLGKTILSEVSEVIGNGLKPLVELIAKGMVTITIISLLIFIDPKLSLTAGFFLSGSYFLIYSLIRKKLRRMGERRLVNNKLRFTAVVEAFGAVKEVKVGGLEEIYIDRYAKPAYVYAKAHSIATLFAQLPRFFLEAISFGGILLVILYLVNQTGSFNKYGKIDSLL